VATSIALDNEDNFHAMSKEIHYYCLISIQAHQNLI